MAEDFIRFIKSLEHLLTLPTPLKKSLQLAKGHSSSSLLCAEGEQTEKGRGGGGSFRQTAVSKGDVPLSDLACQSDSRTQPNYTKHNLEVFNEKCCLPYCIPLAASLNIPSLRSDPLASEGEGNGRMTSSRLKIRLQKPLQK